MKRKIILVDMDGVLCQYDERVLEIAHKRFGLPLYHSNEVTNFDTEKIFPEAYHERVDAIADEEGFFRDLMPFPGVIDALHEIEADGRFHVFICTAPKKFYRNSSCVSEKNMWVSRFLGRKWTDKVILTRDKTLVRGDVLIDDKPEVVGVADPTWVQIYHDRPYNRNIDRPRIISWENWKDIIIPILYQ